MNNRFKFRVWTGFGMEYNTVVGKSGAFYALIDPNDSACLNPTSKYAPETPIMQCTGCVDATGKEIYDGDILEYSNNGKHIGYIRFLAGIYFLTFSNQTEEELGYLMTNNLKVIGNMLESPALYFANQ